MSLDVTLSVNGRTIGHVHIVNRGAPAVRSDEINDPDGWRRYEWATGIGRQRGEVLHRRGDGAAALASRVLSLIAENAPAPDLAGDPR